MPLLQMESLLVILIALEPKRFQMNLHQPMVNLPTKILVHFMVQGKTSKLKTISRQNIYWLFQLCCMSRCISYSCSLENKRRSLGYRSWFEFDSANPRLLDTPNDSSIGHVRRCFSKCHFQRFQTENRQTIKNRKFLRSKSKNFRSNQLIAN